MAKYVVCFPETPDSPAVPPEELVRAVLELKNSPRPLDSPLSRYLVPDPFEPPPTEEAAQTPESPAPGSHETEDDRR